jgi:hypothetical protein
MCWVSLLDAPIQFFKPLVRHYYIAGRPFIRDKVVQSHSVYPNSYITSSYAARLMYWVSAPDAPTQLFKQVVRHYYITGRLFSRDKIVQSYSMYPNSYIMSSYATRMMCWVSVPDTPVQVLKPLVNPGNVLLTNCRVWTADCIYPVKPDLDPSPKIRCLPASPPPFHLFRQEHTVPFC